MNDYNHDYNNYYNNDYNHKFHLYLILSEHNWGFPLSK